MRSWGLSFVVAATVAFTTPALAGDTALADRLFKEGQDLLRNGRVTEACVKFEKSIAEENQLGTLLNLAFCHEKATRMGKAWIEYREAETRAVATGNKDRARFSRERMAEVEKELTKVRVDGAPVKEVWIDGDFVARVENGDPFFVETGLRKFRFVDREQRFVVRDVHITKSPFIQPIKVPVPNEVAIADTKAQPAKDAQPAASSPWPWVAFGGAAVGLGVAATCGLFALDKAEEAINAETAKNPDAQSTRSSAQTLALFADIGWGIAAVGTVTGIILLVYPPSPTTSPSVGSQSSVKVQFYGTRAGLSASF